ncbi:MAG: PKD domain-containing protein, partial [Promethearchaeota archaeon]
MEQDKLFKSEKNRYILAIFSLYLILSAFLIGCKDVWGQPQINNFTASRNPVDVGEDIQFEWEITGYQQVLINFGDGTPLDVTGETNIIHSYSLEGRYDVIITAIDSSGDSTNRIINMVVENNAPSFSFAFDVENNIAYEDESVNISVVDMIESDFDKVPGVLTYIYDFAEGTESQVLTNQSSVIHAWSNAGTYPVTISVVDDQGALSQQTKDIKIINQAPSAEISIAVDEDYGEATNKYIATYNWQNAIIDSIPNGWTIYSLEGLNPPLTSVSIVESGDEAHDKVLRLNDNSHQKGISIGNTFEGQDYGTVEFWVRSSDISSKTWALSLWDDTDMALQVLVDDMNWQYTTNTNYYSIYSSFNAEADLWYHVRIDFCIDNSSGNYYNLTSQQFRITVNDLESSIFTIDNVDITKINTLKLETSIRDTGTSWIDAIGYSWDPYYQVGDNRNPVITYSDKVVFLMNAINIVESESDMDSLRYFWQFGDGTCSFGKYVQHQYGAPGFYKIVLMVKDDNGEIDIAQDYLSVNNMNPTIDINSIEDPITVYEGQTIGFNADVIDDASDMASLEYFWNFEFDDPIFDPNNLDEFEYGGWKKSHIYSDDYTGDIYTVVRDPDNYTSYSSVGVNVLNVDPTLSIWDASIVADCSVLISRSSEEIDADFTIALLGNNEPILYKNFSFTESNNNFIYFTKELVSLSLSKYWQLVIKSSIDIPEYSWFKYDLILLMQNGETLILSSDKLYGGSDGYWEVVLNPYFYDSTNHNFRYPVTFHTHVWDPSTDDITLSLSYDAHFLLNLNSSTSLPGGYSSTKYYTFNDVDYRIIVYEQAGSNYANISINQLVAMELYDENNFPVALNLNFTIDPLLNLTSFFNIIETDFPLSNIALKDCLEAEHCLSANIFDDDGGSDALTIKFNTMSSIAIENLCPKLIPNIPILSSETRNITIYAQVWDYDENLELMNAFLLCPIDYSNTTIIDELVCDYINTSNKLPIDTHRFIESNNGTFYIVDSTNPGVLLKSINEGNTWNSILTLGGGYEIAAMWYDRNMEVIYLACSNDIKVQIIKHRLYDDYSTYSSERYGGNLEALDLALIDTMLYVGYGNSSGNDAYMVFGALDTNTMSWMGTYSLYMGTFNDRQYKISSFVTNNTQIYYLWQWVNENVELWFYNVSDHTFTNLNSDSRIESLLTNTDLLERPYRGLTHDGAEIISVLLKNTEYTEKGHYPATMSFKNDDVPNEPDCFEEIGTAGGTVNVISELDGHKKVLKIFDNSLDLKNAYVIKELSSTPNNGTVEYWMWSDNTWKINVFRLDNGNDASTLVRMRTLFNVLQYYNGTSWKNIRWIQNNTWYHFRVDFECSTDGYQGLSQYSWCLYVNGIKYGPFPFETIQPQAYQIAWYTSALLLMGFYSYCIDAIGFSWDPDYITGDNINPTDPGHFPATYSFRYDDPPNEPDTFEVVGTAGGTVNVRSMIDGHKDVVELYDNHTGLQNARVIKELDIFPDHGTLEYWMRSDDASKLCGFRLDNGAVANSLVRLRTLFNVLQYNNGTNWKNVAFIQNNTWYHLRIDFECTSGGYRGLSQYTWRLFINSINYGVFPFENNEAQASQTVWNTDNSLLGFAYYYYYIDAIGFSWDPDYMVGDNINPTEPGHYPATYSFENDFLPNEPDSFEEIGTVGGTVNVINVLDGHKKILQLFDNNSLLAKAYVIKELSSTPTNGTIEYWMRSTDVFKVCGFRLDNGSEGGSLVKIRTLFNVLQYEDGEGWHNIRFMEKNRWYHFRIEFECTDGDYKGLSQYSWRLFVDGIKYGDFDFTNNVTQGSRIEWHTGSLIGSGYYFYYIDAIGFSWDPEYEIGDNLFMESKYYYCTYSVSSNTLIRYRQNEQLALMLNRNTAPGNSEKAFSIGDKIYQTGAGGMITLSSTPLFNSSKIRAISDNYLFTDDGKVYKLFSPYFTGDCSVEFFDGLGSGIYEGELSNNLEFSTRHFTIYEGILNFVGEEFYLITMKADDGFKVTKSGGLLSFDLTMPFATIRDFPNETVESEEIQLMADISVFGQEDPDPQVYNLKWIFGDGSYSYIQNPRHAWTSAGTYNVTLLLVDCYGNKFITNKTIEIKEQAPEINGPFYFQGVEEQGIILDIGIYDSIIDEQYLSYSWYNDIGTEILDFKNNSKPILVLNDGEYNYTLKVEDKGGNIATANITVYVEDVPPILFVTNYGYYGTFGGMMKLNAYVLDNANDIDNMEFEWILNHGTNSSIYNTLNTGICNTLTFENYMKPTVCLGQIKVNDSLSGKSSVASFTITNLIDSNRNNIPDDYEWMIEECGWVFNISITYQDDDLDNLINFYETNVSYTNPYDPDTDNDGLYDGYDIYGFGERPFKTDPNNPDTDGDLLDDSTEVFGWSINSELLGDITVTSDPLKNDTDGEGLLDNIEFEKGTDPRNRDTDNEGLNDFLDPYPLKRDKDEDGLNDFFEFLLGTELNVADTDGDSLSDGQEVLGWGFRTNPLSRDSDHDFLLDAEEVNSYQFKLEERTDLSTPVYLWFNKFMGKALSAQLAICIVFGEVSTEGEGYGIADVPDVEVTVTKMSANLELYKGCTNGSRYFSEVIDIREKIEEKSLNYWGGYKVSINDTTAGCLLEQFEIGVTGYLNPNNPDFDRDKIMDGVEKDLLVNGTSQIDFNEVYLNNNFTTHYSSEDLALMHYSATNSFENDTIGADPGWFEYVNENGGSVQVIKELGGHSEVLELHDESTGYNQNAYVLKTISRNSGTIEYWMRFNATTKLCGFRLDNGDISNELITIRAFNNFFQLFDGTSFQNIIPIQNNTWYHIRVDFECTSGQYRGLSQYTMRLLINGITIGVFPFVNNEAQASRIEWYTDRYSSVPEHYYFIDAIGLSWDSNYKVGDNFIGENGSYFLEPGNFPGTYSFEQIPIGGQPSAWVINETGGNLQVIEELDGHKSIVEMNQTTSVSAVSMTRGLIIPHQSGTIEWWWRTTNASHITEFGIGNTSVNFLRLRINNNKYEFNNGAWNELGLNVSDNTWYHISIAFECTSGSYRGLEQYSWLIYINEIYYGNFTFEHQGFEIDEVWFKTGPLFNYMSYIDAISFSWDRKYVVGENLQDITEGFDEFTIEIPDIGIIYDAELRLKIESEGIPTGSGTIIIELAKEDINTKIKDVFLIANIEHFTNTEIFSFKRTFDLSLYIDYGMINRYFGKYRLNVKVFSTQYSDIFNITEFILSTDTFVQAGSSDTEAWITDPGKRDTDGDGLTDYWEIYGRKEAGYEPTNPLSEDTDGDGTTDFYDRDPLRDLILEITPIYGFHNGVNDLYTNHPVLEITISFSSGGQVYSFYSVKKRAHENPKTVGWWIFSRTLYRTAYFDGTHGSYECHYYANIEDHWFSSPIKINLALWEMDIGFLLTWDDLLLSATRNYDVGLPGNTQIFEIGFGHRMAVQFKTIALNKTNTIAIYDEATVFNDHYQTKERFNIIQLYVKDGFWPLLWTPFVRGANTIVIPTSLFKETLLNKYVQDERIEETPLYHESNEDYYQFISVDREGTTKEACGDLDFIFVRFEVTAAEAVEILHLLLTCIINETTNETALKYKFASTKRNGFSPVMMNLPLDALSFIPWKFEFQNSQQGDQPRDFWQSLADAVVAVGEFIVGVFVAIGEFFLAIWDGIVSLVFGTILLAILEFLAYILWCLIRAALLILIWIAFGITVLFLTLGIATIAVALIPISLIFGASMYYTINSVGIDFPGFSFATGYDTGIDNYEAFDIPVPYINGWFALGGNRIIDVTIKFWPPEFEFNSTGSSYKDEEASEGLNAPIDFDSLKTSAALDWDVFKSAVPMLSKGYSASRNWWTIAVPFGIAAITLPSEVPTLAVAKYAT